MVGSMDKIVLVVIAIAAYWLTPGSYTREAPLAVWTFEVALPADAVETLLVKDFERTATSWMQGIERVTKAPSKPSYIVQAEAFNMYVRWQRLGKRTWLQRVQGSPMFVTDRSARPATAFDIASNVAVEWAAEWQLVETSATTTEVQRSIIRLEQRLHRWLPMHLLLPLGCGGEHQRIAQHFRSPDGGR